MTTELGGKAPRGLRATALEKLDDAVCAALRDSEVEHAREVLSTALARCAAAEAVVPAQVRACVEAADDHLGYGECMEARTLLTVAHHLLTPVHVPRPSRPGDVALGG
ncbi:hypothetical protein [Lentzea xinjiangensis]|nr:hypothetical protein [Lentzea xinjiangensis]